MEIKLTHREVPMVAADPLLRKKTQVNIESVVPDTEEDVQSIAWAQGRLLLKGKDLNTHGVTISGEVQASLITIGEDGQRLSNLRLSRPFNLEFEIEQPQEQLLPQIDWCISCVDAKVLNPRKLAVCFEVTAELQPFHQGSFPVETLLPPSCEMNLQLQREVHTALIQRVATEKSFSLHEQFPFSELISSPALLLWEEPGFRVLDTEQVGNRAIVRGELQLKVWVLDQNGQPHLQRFSTAFSQLIDLNDETLDQSRARIFPSSVYFDLIDTVGGEKMLDAELHAVLQFSAWTKEQVETLCDAYSCLFPCDCSAAERQMVSSCELQQRNLFWEDSLTLPDDSAQILSVFPSLGAVESSSEMLQLPVSLQILARGNDGMLQSLHRSITLQGEALGRGAHMSPPIWEDFTVQSMGNRLSGKLQVSVPWERSVTEKVMDLEGLTLAEDSPWERDTAPSLYFIRRAGESFWSLGKRFHTRVETIASCNDENAEWLLIPTD